MLWLFILYALVGCLSLLGLIVILAIGGLDSLGLDLDIDADVDADGGGGGGGPGLLSLPFMLASLSAFGGIGVLSLWAGVPYWLSPFVALGGSAFIIIIVFIMVQRFLQNFISDSTVKISSLKGKKGTVSVYINKGGEGQVVVITEKRGRMLLAAIAEEDIPVNEDVIILEVLGDVVKVMPLTKYRARKGAHGGPRTKKNTRRKSN